MDQEDQRRGDRRRGDQLLRRAERRAPDRTGLGSTTGRAPRRARPEPGLRAERPGGRVGRRQRTVEQQPADQRELRVGLGLFAGRLELQVRQEELLARVPAAETRSPRPVRAHSSTTGAARATSTSRARWAGRSRSPPRTTSTSPATSPISTSSPTCSGLIGTNAIYVWNPVSSTSGTSLLVGIHEPHDRRRPAVGRSHLPGAELRPRRPRNPDDLRGPRSEVPRKRRSVERRRHTPRTTSTTAASAARRRRSS